jgi:hypothetical protein
MKELMIQHKRIGRLWFIVGSSRLEGWPIISLVDKFLFDFASRLICDEE